MSREYVLQPAPSAASLKINYRGELNEQQYAAVSAPPGVSLVLAGAGAGKTRTLTYRVAWLLEHGVPGDRILLLTFTNKASREMMDRVTHLLQGESLNLWGGTFHSVANRILRQHAELLGYKQGFTIADREDASDLLSACVADMDEKTREMRFPQADALVGMFSIAANTGQSLEHVVAARYPAFLRCLDDLIELQEAYRKRKIQAGLMDFDDLLVGWRDLMRDHEAIREIYQRRFQWVLVDEYQDTNHLQGEIIDLLTAQHGNLMVVGDDAQSIYSWRGANFANILDFNTRHPEAAVYRVETNYRSTPEILEVANAVIVGNRKQFPKALKASRSSSSRPVLVDCEDTAQQARFIGQRVLELRDEGVPLEEMCILYRSHFHAVQLQMELTRRNIPFWITSGIRFFEQAHIKDLTAYAKLVNQPGDELAFKRLVRLLPGVGGKTTAKLWQSYTAELSTHSARFVTAALSDNDGGGGGEEPPGIKIAPILAAISKQVPKRGQVEWAKWMTLISICESPEVRSSPARLLQEVLTTDYKEYLQATYDNAPQRLEDCEQLVLYATEFADLPDFLNQLALRSEIETDATTARVVEDERIRLSTVHQAKGLEFDAVFVLMLCDGMFPSVRSLDDDATLEEERRLFYVAVTRARNELYLLFPKTGFSAKSGYTRNLPSRFLREIPVNLLDQWNVRPPEPASGSSWADEHRQEHPSDDPF
jgi:DNA helicase-2/ATP-dependent DNA helicase PcrA